MYCARVGKSPWPGPGFAQTGRVGIKCRVGGGWASLFGGKWHFCLACEHTIVHLSVLSAWQGIGPELSMAGNVLCWAAPASETGQWLFMVALQRSILGFLISSTTEANSRCPGRQSLLLQQWTFCLTSPAHWLRETCWPAKPKTHPVLYRKLLHHQGNLSSYGTVYLFLIKCFGVIFLPFPIDRSIILLLQLCKSNIMDTRSFTPNLMSKTLPVSLGSLVAVHSLLMHPPFLLPRGNTTLNLFVIHFSSFLFLFF